MQKYEINEILEEVEKLNVDNLLKELPNYFKFQGNMGQRAYLNWRFDAHEKNETHFFNIAEGYFDVAINLIAQCLEDNSDKKADIWIFPIMFNFVHGIEIYLKAFNSLFPMYLRLNEHGEYGESKIEGNHDILQLCNTALAKIKNSKEKEFLRDFEFVKKFIEILYDNTNDMSFTRYSISKNKERHFYVSDKNITIDLPTFFKWTAKIYGILKNSCFCISCAVEELEGYKAEEEQFYAGME